MPHAYIGRVIKLSNNQVGLPERKHQHIDLTHVIYLGDDPRKLGEGEGRGDKKRRKAAGGVKWADPREPLGECAEHTRVAPGRAGSLGFIHPPQVALGVLKPTHLRVWGPSMALRPGDTLRQRSRNPGYVWDSRTSRWGGARC